MINYLAVKVRLDIHLFFLRRGAAGLEIWGRSGRYKKVRLPTRMKGTQERGEGG